MLSRTLRQRLGDLLRQGTLFGRSPERAGAHEPSAPRILRAGIEEILPGGVLTRPDGSLFVHERLYNEMGEDSATLFERFAALCDPPVDGRHHETGDSRNGGAA